MTTAVRLHSITDETSARRAEALPRVRGAIQDLAADWKRRSVAERVAAVTVLVVVSSALLMSI
jgi:hypothetical protein